MEVQHVENQKLLKLWHKYCYWCWYTEPNLVWSGPWAKLTHTYRMFNDVLVQVPWYWYSYRGLLQIACLLYWFVSKSPLEQAEQWLGANLHNAVPIFLH